MPSSPCAVSRTLQSTSRVRRASGGSAGSPSTRVPLILQSDSPRELAPFHDNDRMRRVRAERWESGIRAIVGVTFLIRR